MDKRYARRAVSDVQSNPGQPAGCMDMENIGQSSKNPTLLPCVAVYPSHAETCHRRHYCPIGQNHVVAVQSIDQMLLL